MRKTSNPKFLFEESNFIICLFLSPCNTILMDDFIRSQVSLTLNLWKTEEYWMTFKVEKEKKPCNLQSYTQRKSPSKWRQIKMFLDQQKQSFTTHTTQRVLWAEGTAPGGRRQWRPPEWGCRGRMTSWGSHEEAPRQFGQVQMWALWLLMGGIRTQLRSPQTRV